ncbi:MAG: imidazole glycerol phosphate synthase subunit HisH [Gemmatimonadales bacterium]
MRVTLFDYGAGNLHSLMKAIAAAGVEPVVEVDPARAVDTDVLILPGVGAFEPAAARLAPGREVMQRALLDGLPCLGICLGLQLLFEGSDEGQGAGLAVIDGQVTRIAATRLPQIGWNLIEEAREPSLAGITHGYYANSYVGRPRNTDAVVAWSSYEGDRFPAAVRSGRTLGIQFHPEKSSTPGLAVIASFLEAARG